MTTFTPADDTILRQCHESGLSAAETAKQFIGRSRSSVIARWHRLGLTRRVTVARADKPKRMTPFRRPHSTTPPAPIRPYVEPETPRSETNVTIMALTSRTCRFPIGDPQSPAFCYCGSTDGALFPLQPYCRHHQKVARA